MQPLTPVAEFDPESAISTLTTIIFNQYQIPVVCDMIGYPLELDDNFRLVQKPLTSSSKGEC